MTIDRQTVEFIEITSLVPDEWTPWFYSVISEDAPFFWGDNNRTLVTAERLRNHCADRLETVPEDIINVTEEDVKAFLDILEGLGQTYIDLEN